MFGKICSKCKKYKFITEYNANLKTRDGYIGACKSCCAKYQKAYRKQHKKKLADDKRKYREANRGKVLAHKRSYTATHSAKENARSILWSKRNPEKFNARQRLRRFKSRANGGFTTKAQWKELCDLFKNCCACCHCVLKLEMDHIVSVDAGGKGDITNVQPLCRSCNATKNNKTADYRPDPIREWAERSVQW